MFFGEFGWGWETAEKRLLSPKIDREKGCAMTSKPNYRTMVSLRLLRLFFRGGEEF